MEIAFVHPTHPAGGGDGATYTANKLVTELIDRGHDLTLFCLQTAEGRINIDADVTVLNTDGIRPFNVEINRALRRHRADFEGFDIIHSYKPRSVPAMTEIAEITEAGTVLSLTAYGAICPKNDLLYRNESACTENGYGRCTRCAMATADQSMESTIRRGIARVKWITGRLLNLRQSRTAMQRLNHIDAFHSYTTHLKQTYEQFGYPTDRIHTISNILDDAFVSEPRTAVDESIRLLYAGRLTPAKGVQKLVPIYRQTAEHLNREVTLTVAGDGELSDQIADQVDKYRVTDGVELRGYVPYEEMPSLYRTHDIALAPQVWDEPFGRTYMEALASGTPVVASDSGAAEQIIGDAGVITDGSVESMATAVIDIVSESHLCDLSERAVKRVDQYRADTVIPQFEQLYEQVAN